MPKFFIKTNQINENEITIVGEDVKHINQVLRAKIGDTLTVCNIETAFNYTTTISQITPDSVICNIKNCEQSSSESIAEVTIFQGIPKADKMEYIIQKNTELGVKTIVPVEMIRCVAKIENKNEIKKINRWQKIAEAAAKQSGRDCIPKIESPINIQQVCNQINNFDVVFIAYENEKNITLKDELKMLNNNNKLKIGIVIGPEGGLDTKEVGKLVSSGAKVVTLGKRILRTETASICIMSSIMYEFEL